MEFAILEPYTRTLNAGERSEIIARGEVIAVASAAAPFDLEVDSQRTTLQRGYILKAKPGHEFTSFNLVNGDTAQTVTVYVGDGDIELPIPNVVNVVDGAKVRSKSDESHIARITATGAAAVYPRLQLRNPASAANDIFIKAIHVVDHNGATTFAFYNATTTALSNASAYDLFSKRVNGVVDTVRVAEWETDASLPSGTESFHFLPVSGANQMERHVFEDPICIEPGNAFLVANQTVNQTCTVIFEYYEG